MNRAALLLTAVIVIISVLPIRDCPGQADLSPARWSEEDRKNYLSIDRNLVSIDRASSAMVTGTSSPIALRSGLEALRQGGSAVDAALVIALTHTTLAGGCTVSFAGILTLVYYDAASGEVVTLDAGYNTVEGEKDPLTIPRSSRSDPTQGSKPIPKGRTVLVPGFMAGVGAAHDRFGKLPFETIFQPAAYFATEGFPISSVLSRLTESNRAVLSRLAETRAVFFKNDGTPHAPGETFKQPALARTLKRVASEGSDYMYRGPWAKKFVEAVRRDGGRICTKDMENYKAEWREPLHAAFHGHDLYLYPGGTLLAGMLNLMEISDLVGRGHYSDSPEAFFWFCRIIQTVTFDSGLDGLEIRREDWARMETAQAAWEKMRKNAKGETRSTRDGSDPHHSDAVVVVDKDGNMAALLHSSNTRGFGESGLYIDGVSIPDSATFQQQVLAFTEPGKRLSNPTVPLIAMRDGKPVLALSAIGSGIYEESIKCLVNMLGFGKSPQQAIDAPSFVPTFGTAVDSPSVAIAVAEGAFSGDLLENARKMGLLIESLPPGQARRTKGVVAALLLDPADGMWAGGSVRRFCLGY